MAYEPYEWQDGEDGGTPITAERLNHIERGISNVELTPGYKGDPAEARQALGITIDTSVGTRVFVDGTMLYGNTGWRDITPPSFPFAPDNIGSLFIARRNDEVFVSLEGVALVEGSGQIPLFQQPEGFVAAAFSDTRLTGTPVNFHSLLQVIRIVSYSVQWAGTFEVETATYGVDRPDGDIFGSFSYRTDDPWPTSLPGTPR